MTVAWLNGQFTAFKDISISPADRGFLLGDGVFDTMAARDGKLLHPEDHVRRILHNAGILKIVVPYRQEDFIQALPDLLHKNGLGQGYASLRTTITRGVGPRGLAPPTAAQPTVLITATAFDPAFFKEPATAIIAETVRRNENSPLSRIKSLNYGDNLLAKMEAIEKGADEAIMLNNAGHVACGTNCNIFIQEGAEWITPPLTDGILDGITRRHLIEEKPAIEEHITVDRLLAADTVYLTNSIIGVRTVSVTMK